MGYMHIDNLYKNQDILMYKECYAMEKIHGTSSHLSYKNGILGYFAGGGSYEIFTKLFNTEDLVTKLKDCISDDRSVHIYGEFYGGSIQKMSATYGEVQKFVAFEVKIGDTWLNVPKAEKFSRDLGLDFVYYKKIPTTLEAINAERDADSEQAIKNGMGAGHKREGVVLRPLEEVTTNNGERIIAKHKRDEFRETATPCNITDKLVRRTEVTAIINEWLTEERLNHILTSGKVEPIIEKLGDIIRFMIEDIYREGKGEVEESKDLEKAIGRETALMFKRRISNDLG